MPHLFQVAAKGILVQNDAALMLRGTIQYGPEQGTAAWGLPGGRLEKNESIYDTLNREVTEELPGIKNINVAKLLKTERGFHREDRQDLIILYFLITADLNTVKLSSEHTEFVWVDTKRLNEFQSQPAENFFDGSLAAVELALSHRIKAKH